MMKIIKNVFWFFLAVFIIAQFFRPEKNEGDLQSINAFLADTNPPEGIQIILKESCYDCHSDFTRYPWYSNITPVNFWLAHHIKDGKKHFNVSHWEGNSIKRKDHKFEELIEMVNNKDMPLNSYTWTHTEANLSDAQRSAVVDWAQNVRFKYSLQPRPE